MNTSTTSNITLPGRSPLLVITAGWGSFLSLLPLAWSKLDLVAAILLGVALVLINLLWTEKLVRAILRKSSRSPWLWSYPLKLVFNAAFITACLRWLNLNALGLLIGLSAVLPACFTLAILHVLKTAKQSSTR